jgi:hypothetical protein
MDRNNPVWREYLKAIIRIQIDAGVAGVQLDEAELPLTSLQYGGCFCKDCVKGFRSYLRELPPDERPAELRGEDLERFHYGAWLLARGHDFKQTREAAPLFWHYLRFQRRAITRYFAEVAGLRPGIRREQGPQRARLRQLLQPARPVPPARTEVDLIITEMRNTATSSRPGTATSPASPGRNPSSSSRTPTAAWYPSWWRS